jgi:hypothetical protein
LIVLNDLALLEIVLQKSAQQAQAGDAPSKVFIEVAFGTLSES